MLGAAKLILLGGMSYRLFNLQISDREKYKFLSDKNRLRELKTPPERGIITDYFNNIIADNNQVFQLHLKLEEVDNFKALMVRLKEILDLTEKEFLTILKKKKNQKPWENLIIYENLYWEKFYKLKI